MYIMVFLSLKLYVSVSARRRFLSKRNEDLVLTKCCVIDSTITVCMCALNYAQCTVVIDRILFCDS